MTFKKVLVLTGISFELHHQQMKESAKRMHREELNDGCPTPHQFRDAGYIHRQGKRRKHKR